MDLEEDTAQEDTAQEVSSLDGNFAWADVFTTVLHSGQKQSQPVLAKAKKNQVLNDDKSEGGEKSKKSDWESKARLKPDISEKERERFLASVATKGVVQLFNAVNSKNIAEVNGENRFKNNKKDRKSFV